MNASTFQQPQMLQYLQGIPRLLRQPYYNSTDFAHAADKFKSRRDMYLERNSEQYVYQQFAYSTSSCISQLYKLLTLLAET
jgi:hypothetical protein